MSRVITAALGRTVNFVEDIRNVATKSLSNLHDNDKWVQLWVLTLCTKVK